MKKTKIERFIRDNREDFDTFEPSANLWAKIEEHLPQNQEEVSSHNQAFVGNLVKEQPNFFVRHWKIVASVSLLIICFSVVYVSKNSQSSESVIADVSPEYGKQVSQYISLVESKREELDNLAQQNPELYQEFSEDLEKLNQDYQNLKTELPQTPNQEDLVKAMIQNLQVQVDILNQQLEVIQKIKNYHKNPSQSI
jgi:DNA repair exonuclease SbcCD ATPase subunit